MICKPEVLKHVPLFALLDEEETAVLAAQVELKTFAPRQPIYKIGDSSGRAYVVVSGRVRVSTVDQEHQEVVVDESSPGEFFGSASLLEQTPHQRDGRDRRSGVRRSGAGRYCRAARAQAARGDGYARRARPAISCFAAAGAAASQQTCQ